MRSSILVEGDNGHRVLVDTGPDMRAQLLAGGIPRVDAIVYTHEHADHITGLDDVRILNRIAGAPLPAYGTLQTLTALQTRFDYAFRPWTPPGFYRPVMEPVPFNYGDRIEPAGVPMVTFEQDHRVLKTAGLRIGVFGYSTDVVGLDDAAFEALVGIDTWLVGCFQRAHHTTHANIGTIVKWADRVGARRTVLTHMGPDLDWSWMKRHLPPGIEPAVDGMVLEFEATV